MYLPNVSTATPNKDNGPFNVAYCNTVVAGNNFWSSTPLVMGLSALIRVNFVLAVDLIRAVIDNWLNEHVAIIVSWLMIQI